MDACRDKLTYTPADLTAWTVWVATLDQAIAGMIALNVNEDGETAELEHFFVNPAHHRKGIGAALMAELLKACRTRGIKRVGVDSDPYAEPIYARFGFVTVDRAPSKSIPGRTLPRMELRLSLVIGH